MDNMTILGKKASDPDTKESLKELMKLTKKCDNLVEL